MKYQGNGKIINGGSEWITRSGFEKGGFGFAFQKNPGNRVGFSKNV